MRKLFRAGMFRQTDGVCGFVNDVLQNFGLKEETECCLTNLFRASIIRLTAGEDTHRKKRKPHRARPGTKGEIPMEKNVVVLDEQGKKIGMTYPKRARGLVKKGRARCVDACTICLACPPDMDLEDIRMNDNNINIP